MSTIYDRQKNSSGVHDLQPLPMAQTEDVVLPYKEKEKPDSSPEIANHMAMANQALALVDDVVLKNYLTKLSDMKIVPFKGDYSLDNTILYKVNKMVYEKDEYATEKFISVISAMTYTTGTVFMIVDGHKDHTDFYLGIKGDADTDKTARSYAQTLNNAIIGQFPGALLSDLSKIEAGAKCSEQERLIHKMSEATTVSICSGVPALKNTKGEYTNDTFVQGIEKFAIAMQGKEYTAVILAANVSQQELNDVRRGYENIYTQLSAMATQQLAYSTNESLANAISRTKGYADSVSTNDSTSITHSDSTSHTDGTQKSTTHTEGQSKDNFWGKAGKLADPLMEAGAILTATGVGAPLGAIMMGAGAVAGIGGAVAAKQLNKSDSKTEGTNESDTTSHSDSSSQQHSEGTSHSENFSETDGTTSTVGSTKNFTITVQNKHIQEIQKRIDKQLERIGMSESTGMWATSAYFLSYDTDRATAETSAAIFRSIMQGEQSGVELSAINTWYSNNKDYDYNSLTKYICSMSHPCFSYGSSAIMLTPTNMLSSKEVAIAMGLPRKSVPGFPVVEHISLGKEVVKLSERKDSSTFELGCIFDQGIEKPNNKVLLDRKSLTQHTFVTGSTGCGKSETVYKLIDSIRKAGAKFLIIEPAKGEYKNVFGTEHIYGTNPLISNLLKINPFRFIKGVHVLEHADRLIEIFNVCWPMYAAMPAVLKEAVLNAYEDCGWDLITSKNKYSEDIFPTFADLIWELETVIEASAYSEEVKSNYKGSLVTRVKSLANGINGEIFSGQEIGDSLLFDENVIVDISRIGSQETKALIMGILIMRLNEYRANSGIEANSGLRHVTILEEAHNILKRCSQEQSMEGSNVAGKSVEMISNAIAEMRTYGEGFIIVDQSPGAVDISAIRNTNTKIIMRLPEDSDRKIAGKSAAMKDNQVDEIAKLPTGVAVVYQNDWEEPVLCKINMYDGSRLKYKFREDVIAPKDFEPIIIAQAIRFMMQTKVGTPIAYDIDTVKQGIPITSLPTYVKINVLTAIQEYEETGVATIWKNSEFEKFSWVISGLFGVRQDVLKLTKQSRDFDDLTEDLKKLIHKKVELLPTELDLAVCQSLMRDYSSGDQSRLKLYSAWLQNTKEKLNIL